MAFIKTVKTRGIEAKYFRPVAFRWDANAREASIIFGLFVDRSHSDQCKPTVQAEIRDRPVMEVAAKLRLAGEKFDQYLSPEVLSAGAENAGTNIMDHIYAAAKAEPLISDFGAKVFLDASFG